MTWRKRAGAHSRMSCGHCSGGCGTGANDVRTPCEDDLVESAIERSTVEPGHFRATGVFYLSAYGYLHLSGSDPDAP